MFCRNTRYHMTGVKKILSSSSTQTLLRRVHFNKPQHQQHSEQSNEATQSSKSADDLFQNLFNTTTMSNTTRPNPVTSDEQDDIYSQFHQTLDDLFSVDKDVEIEQLKLEQQSIESSALKYNKQVSGAAQRNQGASLPAGRKLLMEWFKPMSEEIKNQLRAYYELTDKDISVDKDLKAVGPYISLLPAEELAVITIHTILSTFLSAGRMSIVATSMYVGRSVNAQVNIARLRKAKRGHVLSHLQRDGRYVFNVNRTAAHHLSENVEWPSEVAVQVGSFLINILLDTAKIPVAVKESDPMTSDIDKVLNDILSEDESNRSSAESKFVMEPAFKHCFTLSAEKKVGMLVPHEALTKLVLNAHAIRETLNPVMLPMIVPPKPWVGYKEGGYMSLNSSVMRSDGSKFQNVVLKHASLQTLFDGLNVLNRTEWLVNKSVYDTILKVWEAGGGIGALPARQDHNIELKPILQENQDQEEFKELFGKWKKTSDKLKQLNRDLHSLRCDMLYKLEIARDFKDKSFFFPHNIDFRGRAYPIPPHLNQMGSDINRGMLVFKTKRPVGKNGVFWMKIHLANLYGMDKLSFDERIQFIDNNLDKIMSSADNPLPGLEEMEFTGENTRNTTAETTAIRNLQVDKCWWLQSENPWQTLAACIELTNCLRSENPEEYETNIPIQMDGSCNGLQHYAALGRDNLGGLHVNLLPTEKPMDVYTGVLNVVKKIIDKDAAIGVEPALLLQGKIYRSTIKQTVMTSVYGVTFIGARDQIKKRLKEKKEIPEDKIFDCSVYLAKVTLQSLGEVFQSAKEIMDWLNELAHIVSTTNNPVIWITPMGLPVVQPYRSFRRLSIKTVLQSVNLVETNDSLPVNRARQKSAFPPNYVHSLDASHMFMTAIECEKRNIQFAAVHDSFWTHAGDVDEMNVIIRDKFIELHSQPLLETLLESLKTLHPELTFPPVPKKGCLKLERVSKAKYFFD